jgi:Ca2+-binding EF-hand superfamily protein
MKAMIVLGTAVLAAGMLSTAQAGERTFGDSGLPAFLDVYDVDTNGVLSAEETQVMRQVRAEVREWNRKQWDADGDGVISEQEKLVARDRLRDRIEECRAERFAEADTDGDGYLSFEEFSALPSIQRLAAQYPDKPALIFDRLDADDDNLVSLEEFLACLETQQMGKTSE